MIIMDRFEKIHNIAGAVVFGILGLGALGGVIFAGATHQWVMVIICGAMTAASIAEIPDAIKTLQTNKTYYYGQGITESGRAVLLQRQNRCGAGHTQIYL